MTSPDPVITIGNFDGVHVGHQALLTRARDVAQGAKVIAVSFDPHPLAVLRPDAAPPEIEPYDVRVQRLLSAGADDVVTLDPRSGVLEMSPKDFLDQVITEHTPGAIVEGHDFRFGKARAGTPNVLRRLASERGVDTHIVGPVNAVLTNQHIVEVSSSLVRWCVKHGRVRDAAYLLGRPHELRGSSIRGDQLGRTIGFPTINLDTTCLRPSPGVYAGFARVNNERVPAAINVGVRPSVTQSPEPRVEAHLLNNDGSPWTPSAGLPEYGFDITLELVGWVRDEIRFSGVEALSAQIRRDTKSVVETLSPSAV